MGECRKAPRRYPASDFEAKTEGLLGHPSFPFGDPAERRRVADVVA
jgi:hypothetical protein